MGSTTTTTTQRRDRRRELEEKYGLKPTTNKNITREENFTDVIAGWCVSQSKFIDFLLVFFYRNSTIKNIIDF